MIGHVRFRAVLAAAALLAAACDPGTHTCPVVVGTTANIGAIVSAIGGNRFEVVTITPAGMCPGHFDIRPSHVAAANRASLLINQGWERWFPELKRSVSSPGVRFVTATTPGNWMLPETHKRAVLELADILAQADSVGADTFHLLAAHYLDRIDSVARWTRDRLRGNSRPPVLASERQAPFLRWLGFRVVATYGRPGEITARKLTYLAQVGVDSGVGLVVDNLQSGPDAGLELARALKAKHVNLTNFPLGGDYLNSLTRNVRDLAAQLE